ncbi:MAG: nucleotidyltransferase family protein [Terriglobia bacterium]
MAQIKIPIPVERVRAFCRKWRIADLSVFGSALRDDFRPDSDVDLLVTFAPDAQWGLYDWMNMIAELREIFGREVDLLSRQSLRNPFRRHEILKTCESLYAA